MAFLFRWLMRAVLAVIALAAGAAVLAYYLASQSLPDYDATLTVDGPAQEIEIVRDRYAVPHILSKTDRDAFFGLGLRARPGPALADDAAAAHGAGAAERDLRAGDARDRRADAGARPLRAMRGRRWRMQTDDARAALEAYADGVNAWLRVVQREALGRGAPEFFLFSPDISPWTPADSIAVQKLMALQMTDKAAMETLRARLSLALPPERLRDILPDSPNAPLMGLPQFSELFPDADGGAGRRGGAKPARPAAAAGARRRVERLRGHGAADGGRRAAARHRPAPGAERALDLDAGADGPRRGAGDGRRRSRGSRR